MKRSKLVYIIICVLFLLTSNAFTQTRLIKKVVLDAGHGGKDPGACAKTVYEKDIALSIVLKLGKFIQDNFKDVEVIYTRKTDVFVELYNRASIANQNKADLFVSVHCNSNNSTEPYGFETYVMGPNKNKAQLEIAKKENASILMEDNYSKKYDGYDPNSPEADVIFTLYQNAFLEQSMMFSNMVQTQFREKLKRYDRGVKQAGFWVLCKTTMPSVLVEAGFVSNPDEEKFIGTEQGQIYIASSLYRAFKDYKAKSEGTTAKSDDQDKLDLKISSASDSVNTTKLDVVPKKSNEKELKKVESTDKKGSKTNNTSKNNLDIKAVDKKSQVKTDAKSDIAAKSSSELPVYKVQILNSSKKLALNAPDFKGVNGISTFQDAGLFKYTVGVYSTLAEASAMTKKMKEKGFEGAFVVAFQKDKKISLDEAKKLTK